MPRTTDSFKALKVAIAIAPILRLPDFERQFVITTDASDVAIGAILEQDFGSGLQPIAFSSRKLNSTEIRYSAYERELLGIVWAIGQWKHYFQGPHPIVIQTDHAPLRHLPNQTSVQQPSLALACSLARVRCGHPAHSREKEPYRLAKAVNSCLMHW